MLNYNKCILGGRLTRDPEIRHSQSGIAVANFALAVNYRYKDSEEVCYIDVTAFGRLAEIVDTYLHKGSAALVEGRLKLDKWEQDGQRRQKHCISASAVQMLDKPPAQDQDNTPF